jgi:hypothetical protein
MATLSKIFTQLDRKGNDRSHLEVCVDYDPKERTVTCVNYIRAIDCKTGVSVPIECILLEKFTEVGDQMVDSIDWMEVYAAEGPGLHPVMAEALRPFVK